MTAVRRFVVIAMSIIFGPCDRRYVYGTLQPPAALSGSIYADTDQKYQLGSGQFKSNGQRWGQRSASKVELSLSLPLSLSVPR